MVAVLLVTYSILIAASSLIGGLMLGIGFCHTRLIPIQPPVSSICLLRSRQFGGQSRDEDDIVDAKHDLQAK